MTRKELFALARKMSAEARHLLAVKNMDRGTEEDPFDNLSDDGLIGIVARMQDKVSRLRRYAQTGKTSSPDKLYDDLLDLQNYCPLFHGLDMQMKEKRNVRKSGDNNKDNERG